MQGDKKIYSQEEKQLEKALTRKVTRGISYKHQGRRRDRQSFEYRHLTTPPTIARGQHLLCLQLVCPLLLEVMSRPNMKSWEWIHKEQGHGFHLSVRDEGETCKAHLLLEVKRWSMTQACLRTGQVPLLLATYKVTYFQKPGAPTFLCLNDNQPAQLDLAPNNLLI